MAAIEEVEMSVTYNQFEDASLDTMSIKPPRGNKGGQGKTAYVDFNRGAPRTFCTPKDLEVIWSIKPGKDMELSVLKEKPWEAFNLEVRTDGEQHAAFIGKLEEMDRKILGHGYANVKDYIPAAKLKAIRDEESMFAFYAPMARSYTNKEGQTSTSFRAKVAGWAPYVGEFIREDVTDAEGVTKKVIKEIKWLPRLVEAGNRGGPVEGKETKFLLYVATDPATGEDMYRETVELLDEDDKPVLDLQGKKVYRWVGPQDCPKGSLTTIVFGPNKVYVVESFGPLAQAHEVMVKPPKPVIKGRVAGTKVVTAEQLEAMAAAARAAEEADEPEEAAEAPAAAVVDSTEAAVQPMASNLEAIEVTLEAPLEPLDDEKAPLLATEPEAAVGSKRGRAEDSPAPAKKSKKKATATTMEDF